MTYALFTWLAIDSAQQLQSGVCLAQQKEQAFSQLQIQGFTPLKMQRQYSLRPLAWKNADCIHTIEQLAALLHAGLPLAKCLLMLSEDHPHSHWRCLLQRLAQQVSMGVPLSEAMVAFPDIFPPVYSKTIATAELTGRLDQSCFALAEQQKRQAELRTKIGKALRYPALLLSVTLIVIVIMLVWVLPQFSDLYRSFNAPLPAFTRALMACSQVLIQHAPLIIGINISAVPLMLWRYQRSPSFRKQTQRMLLRLPIIGRLISTANLSQLFFSLAMTQQAGLPLLKGLDNAAQAQQNPIFRQAVENVSHNLRQGDALSLAIKQQLVFPTLCFQLIRVGEESGGLDHMMSRLAQHYQHQANSLSDALAQMVEPIMMVIMGIVVGGLVLAMYLPIFQLGSILQ
ncbi:protein transport protein HofC [Hafnia alvei]|uniref:protein transport protein HofC n=1 Tax=Hafnia alvei TaxID=569 RepID=UPI0011ED4FC8|nr:protein transport protein HofC [Hafnia alvei]KAA0263155.1 type IV pilin biogenesis protein [Hafnia alvei]NEY27593.1 protein transport protein HofC [Escherichia coli]